MSNPTNLKYTKDHEWMRLDGADVVAVGITAHAAGELGDVVYVDLPEVGRALSAGDAAAEVESVKAVASVYAPLAGEVVEVNEALSANEAVINADPYGAGWMFKLRVDAAALAELAAHMDAAAYDAYTG